MQIDTEGFDSEIIQILDLSKYIIKTIRFEKWFFDSDSFSTHQPDKSNVLGKNGMLKCIEKLESHNYKITEVNDDDGNDYIAKL